MNGYEFTSFTGGTTDDLDSVSVASLSNNDIAVVVKNGRCHVMEFDSTSTDAERPPARVRPTDYSTAGVWKLLEGAADSTQYYGAMSVTGNAVAETTCDTTFRKITAFDTDEGASNGVTLDSTTDNDIEVLNAGDYELRLTLTFEPADANVLYWFQIRKNAGVVGPTVEVTVTDSSVPYNIQLVTYQTLAANDLITAYQRYGEGAGSSDITITEAVLSVRSL